MHYRVKVGDMSLDELYGLDPIDSKAAAVAETTEKGVSFWPHPPVAAPLNPPYSAPAEAKLPTPKQQPIVVSCPVCKEAVAGQRFAPHLEKCLNGGKRGGLGNKKSSSFSALGIGLPYYNVTKKVDHYPQSLVVRVKLKDGGE